MKGDVHTPGGCASCANEAACLPCQLPAEAVHSFERFIRPCVIERGERLYAEDDAFRGLYMLRLGAVKLHNASQRQSRNFREHVRGFFFGGDMVGLDGLESRRHCYSATALDTTAVCWIPESSLIKLIKAAPEVSVPLLRMALRSVRSGMGNSSRLRADERIARFLLAMSGRRAQEGSPSHAFRLPMQRTEIGNYLGVASETVSRVLSGFADQKIVNAEGRQITILDLKRLAAVGRLKSGNDKNGARTTVDMTVVKPIGCTGEGVRR